MRRSRPRLAVGLLTLILAGFVAAGPAQALTINPTFDSSFNSLPLAQQQAIKSDFSAAAGAYQSALSDNVMINIKVSWGSVGGYAMPTNALGASLDPLYGYFSYAQIKSWLKADSSSSYDSTAIANLPASSPVGNKFVLPSAEAKALGLISGYATAYDGYIGFGTGVSYDYNPRDGITSGSYDFTTVVTHEIDEVLGRISGLSGYAPSWATPFDLFRCSNLSGTRNFSYSAASYFSIDGCKTNMGNFNNVGSGDRSDLASAPSFSDIQDAYLYPGVGGTLSTADLMGLDVIGWGYGPGAPGFGLSPTSLAVIGLNGVPDPVPEPSTLALLGLGALGLLLLQRRRLPA
jgi:hypothetical protein